MTKPVPDWLPDEPAQTGLLLDELLDAMRRHWQGIVIGAILMSLVAAGFAWLRPKYDASGFYYTPGWTLADLKRFRSEFGAPEGLTSVLSEAGLGTGAAGTLLVARSETPDSGRSRSGHCIR